MIDNVKLNFEYNGKSIELPIDFSSMDSESLAIAIDNAIAPYTVKEYSKGFMRVLLGEKYWYLDSEFLPVAKFENGSDKDNCLFLSGNYFSSKDTADRMSMYMSLWVNIYTYAARNGLLVEEKDWLEDTSKYFITYHKLSKRIGIGATGCNFVRQFDTIYFNSYEGALQLLDVFREGLEDWYEELKS